MLLAQISFEGFLKSRHRSDAEFDLVRFPKPPNPLAHWSGSENLAKFVQANHLWSWYIRNSFMAQFLINEFYGIAWRPKLTCEGLVHDGSRAVAICILSRAPSLGLALPSKFWHKDWNQRLLVSWLRYGQWSKGNNETFKVDLLTLSAFFYPYLDTLFWSILIATDPQRLKERVCLVIFWSTKPSQGLAVYLAP